MKRSAPLRRGKALVRSKGLPKRNPKRAAEAYARNFGERADAVRAMSCLATPGKMLHACSGPVQAAHARARGMGGCKGDRRDLVPLCARHHAEAGEARTSQRTDFERRYGLDLQTEARRIAEHLDEEGLP